MHRQPRANLCSYSPFIIIFNQNSSVFFYSFLFRILKQGEQKSASHRRAIQQQHQQQLRHDNNQEEAPDYESDFESESRRTDAKEVQLSECRLGQSDDEEEEAEPVSEVMEEVSNVSRGSEDVVYSDTFADVSSSYTSRSSDHSGGRSSRASRSCDGRLERRDSARKVFKDAVVQTQLAPPTYSWTAGRRTSQQKSSSAIEKVPGHRGCSSSALFLLCLQVCPLLEVRPSQIRRQSSHT